MTTINILVTFFGTALFATSSVRLFFFFFLHHEPCWDSANRRIQIDTRKSCYIRVWGVPTFTETRLMTRWDHSV